MSSFAFDSATITSYASLPRTALTFWNGMRQLMANVVLPFSNPIPKNTQLYKIMTTRLSEVVEL